MRLHKFYPDFVMQHFKPVKYWLPLLIFLSIHQNIYAQKDTTVVDTISMAEIDSIAAPVTGEEYTDTTVKHIYDTSQYFFNQKENYNDLFTTEKITPRYVIDSDVNELKSEDDFWYVTAIEKMESRLKSDPAFRDSLLKASNHEITDETQTGFRQQVWFRFLIWFIIIGVFLAAVIYFLLQNKINLFSKKSLSASKDKNEHTHENIFEIPYSSLLIKAENAQDYRVAVRLLFLQTLKLLSETNAIHYQPDYTNLHYLQQLRKSELYNDFFNATHNYEYVWYGKFDILKGRYLTIRNAFLMLQQKIT